jgi:hypothetical protein
VANESKAIGKLSPSNKACANSFSNGWSNVITSARTTGSVIDQLVASVAPTIQSATLLTSSNSITKAFK